MKTKSLILGLCATTIAIIGAISAYASSAFQTNYYVRLGSSIIPITPAAPGSTFIECSGPRERICRVKLVTPNGVVITQATTVYTNLGGTIVGQAVDALSGTVIIP